MKKMLSFFAILLIIVLTLGLASCSEQTQFSVSFFVDGEVYDNVTASEAQLITLPSDPTKDGYVFGGWYMDKDEWKKPFKANSLLEESISSSISVYAKWDCAHSVTEWIVEKEPTCTEEGLKYQLCSVCGEKIQAEKTIALGHDEQIHQAKAPTCTEIGWDAYVSCKRDSCDYTTYAEKAKLSHSYSQQWKTNAGHHYYECSCGAKSGEAPHVSSGPASMSQNEVCSVCAYVITRAGGISFKTLTVNGTSVSGVVSSKISTFSFLNEINVSGSADYKVCSSIDGNGEISDKILALSKGKNTVYVLELLDGKLNSVYIVTIQVGTSVTVSFDSKGGTAVSPITVDEGNVITAPSPEREGYTFAGWSYDFKNPVSSDMTVTASWTANTDTPYKIEYYLEGLDGEYVLDKTETHAGTTDTKASVNTEAPEHFMTDASISALSGNISPDGSLVLKIYYKRNVYTVTTTVLDKNGGSISEGGSYPYGSTVELSVSVNRGYSFLGYYVGELFLSDNATVSIELEGNVEIAAEFEIKPEMANFTFVSDTTGCEITGLINKKVDCVDIPDYVTSIGESAFSGCTSIASVRFSKSLVSIGCSAFYACSGIESISIPGNVKTIGASAFYACSSLTSLVVSNGVVSIGDSAFSGCSVLTSVSIPKSVTRIDDKAFNGCKQLATVKISDVAAWCGIEFGGQTANPLCYAKNLYLGEELVKELNIPDGVTKIGNYAFYNCKSIEQLAIANSVESIGNYAFYYCSNIKAVSLGSGISEIGAYAFYYCSNLLSIIIPESVSVIGVSAFENCNKLTIYCEAVSLPAAWNSGWNPSNRTVVWDCKK